MAFSVISAWWTGLTQPNLDVQVITAPSLRLDLDADRARLDETVARLEPRLLVLDPFVRLHRINENVSGDVAPLLAFVRELQRRYAVAVILVHHAKKGASAIRAGKALRGSSEFHAWGHSNFYLRRDSEDRIVLTVEHRAAAAISGMALKLVQTEDALALQTINDNPETESNAGPASVDQRISAALANGDKPQTFAELRASCQVRTTTLYKRLAALTDDEIVIKSADGYSLAIR